MNYWECKESPREDLDITRGKTSLYPCQSGNNFISIPGKTRTQYFKIATISLLSTFPYKPGS